MKKIFIFGASIVYGVGAESLGWADLIKQKLHVHMYGPNGAGEKFEVYNFAKSGAEVDYFLKHAKKMQQLYAHTKTNLAILSVGMNNTKAINTPSNYVSSLPKYQQQMDQLLVQINALFTQTVCVGYTPVDESKTNPKHNPLSGNISYFSNQRIFQFDRSFHQLCRHLQIPFVDLSDIDQSYWLNHCLYQDGVHPNQQGHQLIFDRVWPHVEEFIHAPA